MVKTDFGNWHVECIPEDGARISVLKYFGNDLLTLNTAYFRTPERDYGEYELRPVYGYDDCFPTVVECKYPGGNYQCRDHGDLYMLKWNVITEKSGLICSTVCNRPEINFTRILEFAGNKLIWSFKVENRSGHSLPFLHVMHPLMPLNFESIEVPGFKSVLNEGRSNYIEFRNPMDVNDYLLKVKGGNYEMLVLKNVKHGNLILKFTNGLRLSILYDSEIFPSLAIWWNNRAYPDEDGLKRSECAFEPIPGTCSNLEKSFKDGIYLNVNPYETYKWEITWMIN